MCTNIIIISTHNSSGNLFALGQGIIKSAKQIIRIHAKRKSFSNVDAVLKIQGIPPANVALFAFFANIDFEDICDFL